MTSIATRLTINGRPMTLEAPASMSLADLLRERLGLTGTPIGCDTAQCGACTVHLDGVAVKSCNVLATQANGRSVTTIEGLAHAGEQAEEGEGEGDETHEDLPAGRRTRTDLIPVA